MWSDCSLKERPCYLQSKTNAIDCQLQRGIAKYRSSFRAGGIGGYAPSILSSAWVVSSRPKIWWHILSINSGVVFNKKISKCSELWGHSKITWIRFWSFLSTSPLTRTILLDKNYEVMDISDLPHLVGSVFLPGGEKALGKTLPPLPL